MIVITRQKLVGLNVFATDLAWFDKHVPSGRVALTDRSHLMVWLALNGGGFSFGKWLLTECDTSHHGADLVEANFEDAYLEGAHFLSANLKRANFCRAYLANADLRRTNMVLAILRFADLSGAYLTSANLAGADLTGAIVVNTIFDGANLLDAVRSPKDPPIPGWVTYVDVDGNVTRLKRES